MPTSRVHELYRVLFDHVDNMVCTLDLEGRFTSVNPAGERLTGFTAHELVGRFAVEVIAPDHRDQSVRQFLRRLETRGQLPADESVLLTADGRRVPIEVTSELVLRDGEPVGVLGLVREQVQAEQDLAVSQARLAEAQRIGQIGDWQRDGPDRPLTWSEETYRIFGIDPAEGPPTFDRLLAAVHPDDRDDFVRVVKQCRQDGRPYSHEYRVVLPDGAVRWVQGRGELVAASDPSMPPITRGTAQDVTERKEAEERLAEAQRIAQVGNWAWHESSEDLSWSDELFRILDLDPEVDVPSYETLVQRVHPDDRDAFEQVVEAAKARADSYTHQYRIVLRDGSVRWIEGRGVASTGPNGLRMNGTAQDIT
jgi:PAS domain S-box-containing protein